MDSRFAGAEAARLADSIEAAASRDLYQAAPAALGMRFMTIGGATALIAPALPFTYFNRVMGLGNATPATAAHLDELTSAYDSAGVRDYWIHMQPGARPPTLPTLLTQRGFTLATRPSWAKFLRGPEPLSARGTELTIREATSADVDTIANVVCTGYELPHSLGPWFMALVGRPRWHVWVAECGNQVVATGSLFAQGENAWLGVAATLPEHRGLGAQTALLGARINSAAELGCRVLAVETGLPVGTEPSPSLANIRRAGFTQVSSRLNYASPRPAINP